jgi:hypothetical protein
MAISATQRDSSVLAIAGLEPVDSQSCVPKTTWLEHHRILLQEFTGFLYSEIVRNAQSLRNMQPDLCDGSSPGRLHIYGPAGLARLSLRFKLV